MILGAVASSGAFSSVAGKSWTVGIAIIGLLIFLLGVVGALGAYTKNRLILMIVSNPPPLQHLQRHCCTLRCELDSLTPSLTPLALLVGCCFLAPQYVVFLGCMLLIVFIIGVFIAASSPTTLIRDGWNHANNDARTSLQDYYTCCGLDNPSDMPGIPCPLVPTGAVNNTIIYGPTTTPCMSLLSSAFDQNFAAMGWMGVVISITMGVCMIFAIFLFRMVSAAAPRFSLGQ